MFLFLQPKLFIIPYFMRKIILRVIAFYSLILAPAACSKNEDPLHEHSRFSINSTIYVATRVPALDSNGQGHFSEGDINTVFFQDTQNRLLKELSYTYGNTYYWSDFQLEDAIGKLNVSACYPPVKTDSPTVFYWDVTSQEVVTVDFLAAPPVEVTQGVTTDVVLKFNHLMHKLVVKLKATGTTITEKDLGEAKVSVSNFQSAAVIDLLKAKVQRASGTISQLEHTGIESIFILPPQPIGTIAIKVELNGRSKTFQLSECKVGSAFLTQLQSGKVFMLTISVSRNSFTITGQDIAPWGDQGEANGNITI